MISLLNISIHCVIFKWPSGMSLTLYIAFLKHLQTVTLEVSTMLRTFESKIIRKLRASCLGRNYLVIMKNECITWEAQRHSLDSAF